MAWTPAGKHHYPTDTPPHPLSVQGGGESWNREWRRIYHALSLRITGLHDYVILFS